MIFVRYYTIINDCGYNFRTIIMRKIVVVARDIIAVAAIGVVANLLSSALMSLFTIIDNEIRFTISYVLAMSLMLAGVCLYNRFVAHGTERIMVRLSGFNPATLLWGLVLIVALSIVLAPLMRLLPEVRTNVPTGLISMLCVVVVAPIFEEVLFRGKIFSVFSATLSPLLSALASALLFGVMHGNVAVALEAFVVGIVLSYIYILKGSIFAPILLHIMNNIVAYVMMIFKYQERTIEDFIGDLPIFSTIYIVSAVVVLLGAIHVGYIFVKANRVVANGGELIAVSRGEPTSNK